MTLLTHARDAWLYAAIVAFVAATIYWVVEPAQSSSSETTRFEGASMSSTAPTKKEKTASVGDLIGGLERRLEENPNDGKGWLLLAKSHDHLGNTAAAWSSYARAKELGTSDDALEIKLTARLLPAPTQQ